MDVQGQGGGRILDVDGQGGCCLENWTIFMEVMCVSSLTPLRMIKVKPILNINAIKMILCFKLVLA